MKIARRAVAVAIVSLAALVAVGVSSAQNETPTTASQDDGDKVVLTVGITGNSFDTLNPITGYTATDYDVWNNQYETVTRKAAKDFATTPGLAESWTASNGGKTYTYKLRAGLKWSDGQPLTAEDVAFTINRGREEEWQNSSAWVQNLTAKVLDDRTVVVSSSVPDPKLPGLGDIYILPKHIWSKLDAKAILKYPGEDGVGSGPFTLSEFKRGQYVRLVANPNFWEGTPAYDEIVFRIFNNADAMVAALVKGEIDAAWNVPTEAVPQLRQNKDVVVVAGFQGGFDEIAINGGAGLKKPHPALLDRRVRVAIAHAIDRKTLLARVYGGIGAVAQAVSPSPDPAWTPTIPLAQQFDFDLAKSNQILDQAGYKDTNGDGIREMPGGGEPLKFSYYVRSDSDVAPPVAEFMSGWMKKIGIELQLKQRRLRPAGPGDRQGRLRHVPLGVDAVRRSGRADLVLPLQPDRHGRRPDVVQQRRELVRPGLRQAVQAAERRAGQDEASRARAPDADSLPAVGHLRRLRADPGHRGVPHR